MRTRLTVIDSVKRVSGIRTTQRKSTGDPLHTKKEKNKNEAFCRFSLRSRFVALFPSSTKQKRASDVCGCACVWLCGSRYSKVIKSKQKLTSQCERGQEQGLKVGRGPNKDAEHTRSNTNKQKKKTPFSRPAQTRWPPESCCPNYCTPRLPSFLPRSYHRLTQCAPSYEYPSPPRCRCRPRHSQPPQHHLQLQHYSPRPPRPPAAHPASHQG